MTDGPFQMSPERNDDFEGREKRVKQQKQREIGVMKRIFGQRQRRGGRGGIESSVGFQR